MPKAHDNWPALQQEYENDPQATHTSIAAKYGIAKSTVARHAQLHAWRKPGELTQYTVRAAQRVNLAAEAAILSTCKDVAAQVRASTTETLRDLAPWIEKMRADHVKYIVGLSQKALKRLDLLFDTAPPKAPKDEQFSAAAIDKHDAIIRRNLGMSDQNSSNSLNLNVLVAGGRSVHDPDPKIIDQ